MKNCWKILEIEETTDVDIIRRAYLALLPSFHPETDPQGFKQLRQAYEDAGNDSNLLIVFYVQIMPDDFVMQLHRF